MAHLPLLFLFWLAFCLLGHSLQLRSLRRYLLGNACGRFACSPAG